MKHYKLVLPVLKDISLEVAAAAPDRRFALVDPRQHPAAWQALAPARSKYNIERGYVGVIFGQWKNEMETTT